jgi:uncharacterized repeat protein (TIGR04138 family)
MAPETNKAQKTVKQVVEELGCYSPEAFDFLHQGLDYTVQKTHGPPTSGVDHLLQWLRVHGAGLTVEDLRRLIEAGEPPAAIVELIRSLGGLELAAQEMDRHVGGDELCWCLRDLAVKQWGLMAPAVLRHWGIRSTKDFGRMVFALVENGLLQKQPDDRIEDFDDVYDFDQAFDKSYKITLLKDSPTDGNRE